MTHHPDVEAYIERSADFAQPTLRHIRAVFHATCPDLEESIKWGMPHFEFKGILAHIAAFKSHTRLAFWKGELLTDADGWLAQMGESRMGVVKIGSMDDVPPDDVLRALILDAMDLNERGIQPEKETSVKKPELEAPDWFMDVIAGVPGALKTWEGFSPSHRKEYIEWVTEAKRESTRKKRIKQAVEWIAEGKPKEWKYMKEWRQ